MIRWWAQGIRDIQVTVTPHQVQLLSGTALNILRQILIGQKHVTKISQWYGETVGFWNGETLVAWTDNVQGWSMSHALPEFSNELEVDRGLHARRERNIHLEITIYDPLAFAVPLHLEAHLHLSRRARTPSSATSGRSVSKHLWNVNGRLQPVAPGTVIQYRIPDWYDRPWARIWEEYFEQGMQRPAADESIFDFTDPAEKRAVMAPVATARSRAPVASRALRHHAEPSAASTRAGVSGYCRSRTPVASKNALPIAATTAGNTSSPAPLLRSCTRWTTIGVTAG